MHDKARPHIAGIVQQYLQEVQLPVLEWLAQSPDMNPIEHVWDHLEQALKRHQRDSVIWKNSKLYLYEKMCFKVL
jgi:hypothetical protein